MLTLFPAVCEMTYVRQILLLKIVFALLGILFSFNVKYRHFSCHSYVYALKQTAIDNYNLSKVGLLAGKTRSDFGFSKTLHHTVSIDGRFAV